MKIQYQRRRGVDAVKCRKHTADDPPEFVTDYYWNNLKGKTCRIQILYHQTQTFLEAEKHHTLKHYTQVTTRIS